MPWSSLETLWRSVLGHLLFRWVGCREAVALADTARLPRPLPQVCLKYYEYEFMELACQCPAVVCCRCAPTQKAQIVRLLQERTGKLTCAVGKLGGWKKEPLGIGQAGLGVSSPRPLALSACILPCRCAELTSQGPLSSAAVC